ncbi:predicted protein [Nematostella vectensis]|uniref:Uncharacterized protein n=1 Tax=Nematostella vectensis TaxID=45351 RepID=A7SPB0_NEMVE|nr:predicted protein [Nematostella vectensis]|eukprot:XP_001626561.1 predicted protein [Nematostella vectensis]
MTSKDEVCSNCGNKGVIAYYYLGLQNKVKNWFRDENMCNKMLSHWNEREHWLGVEQSWPIKKEMWDGERWNELQWFWDPNKTWVIPCRCEHCGIPIPAKHLIESQDAVTAGKKLVECPECLESFEHSLKTTNGSPINIALIGHWDGWQAFSSSTRSCGSLEVSIANMKKADRSHTSEVYVVGFVPLSSTPKLPETYDPFLQPLMEDICEGFINGFEVRLPQEPNMKRVRVLLLCWSGDHPGQCEVGKLLNQGKCACRRCKLVGQHLPMNESNNHMYYGDNRIHYRHKWESRDISLMLTDLYDVEAESRISVRKRMSSEKVFERAVKGYTKTASNCRGVEKTFALAESRREFLKPYSTQEIGEQGKINMKVGIASSIETARMAVFRNDVPSQSFLLGAMDNMTLLERDERIKVAHTLNVPLQKIPQFSFSSKKCFLPDKGYEGTVCSSGESVVVMLEQNEIVMKLDKFLSVKDNTESYKLLAKGYLFCNVYTDNGQTVKHFWSGFTYVESNPERVPHFCTADNILRKVIIYSSSDDTSNSVSTVVEYQRHQEKLPFDIIVPIYPEQGDMLLVQGAEVGDVWYGYARNVDYARRTVDVHFFVESPRMPNTFIRETIGHAAKNVVPWNSLLGIADGFWPSPSHWRKAV